MLVSRRRRNCADIFYYHTVVYIPKTAVLSVKSCSFPDLIPQVPNGTPEAQLALALALHGELCAFFFSIFYLASDFALARNATIAFNTLITVSLLIRCPRSRLKGKESAWYSYLQSLPVSRVDIALLWEFDVDNGDVDSREALEWIRGTEVSNELRGKSRTYERVLLVSC